MRIRLDKTAFRRGKQNRLFLAPGRQVRVYLAGTNTPAVGYTTEAGGTQVTYPLEADRRGRYGAWYEEGIDYDVLDVASGQRTLWPALSAVSRSGVELGYAALESNAQATTVYPSRTLIAGLSISANPRGRPLKVEAHAPRIHNNAAGGASILSIMEDSVEIQLNRVDQHATASEGGPLTTPARVAAFDGARTYEAALSAGPVGGGTVTIIASGGAVPSRAFIEAVSR